MTGSPMPGRSVAVAVKVTVGEAEGVAVRDAVALGVIEAVGVGV